MSQSSLAERYQRVHRPGQDCRVTSTRNLLELHGYRHSYATVQGLSSTFFFTYRKTFSALDLMTFPSGDICSHYWPVGGQRLEVFENLAYLFNANLVTGTGQTSEQAQESLLDFLRQGVPVLVAVSRFALADLVGAPMRFPPYMGELRFAGHFITVVGCDEARGIVTAFDSDHNRKLEIPLAVLAQARTDGDGAPNYFMQSNNRWVVFLPGNSVASFKDLARTALSRTVHTWLGAAGDDGNAGGLAGLQMFCDELPGWTDRADMPLDKLKASTYVMRMTSDKIAGGSLGRRPFGMFLRQAGDALGERTLLDAAGHYAELTVLWEQLMTEMETRVFDPAGPRSLDAPAIRQLLRQVMDHEQQGFASLQAGVGGLA
jgi:hypothetical protein